MRRLVFVFILCSISAYASNKDSSNSKFSIAFGKAKSVYFQIPQELQTLNLDKSSIKAGLGNYISFNYRYQHLGFELERCWQNRTYSYLAPNPINWYDIVSENHYISIHTWKFQLTYKFINTNNFKAFASAGLMHNSLQNQVQYQFVKDTSINYYWHRDALRSNKVYHPTYWSAGLMAEYNCYKHCIYAQAQANCIRQSPLAHGSNEAARVSFQLGLNIMFSQIFNKGFFTILEKGIVI
jgi:hypothetical protein